MPAVSSAPHCVGLAIFDGKEAEVFVGDVTPNHARVRAIGGTMLPDRFRLLAETVGVDANCVVRERHGKLYTVAFT
jgi:hypothetical protein